MVLHNGVWYQDTTDSIGIIANVTDLQALDSAFWALGSLPLSNDRGDFTTDYAVLTNAVSLTPGESNFISASVQDAAGNINVTYSYPVVGDSSPPVITGLECTRVISIRQGLVTCKWDKIVEYESLVKDIFISIGSEPQIGDILSDYNHPLTTRHFIRDLTTTLKRNASLTSLYFDFKIVNIVGRKNDYEKRVIVDHTPPVVKGVHVVTRTHDRQMPVPLKCQLPTSYAEIKVDMFEDKESGINEAMFEVSLGSKEFSADFLDYGSVELGDDKVFFIDGFSIAPGTTFHATVRIYNKAGLYADATSNPVVVSQSPYLEVSDGIRDNDIDFQSVSNIIQGRWKYSDACPILEAKWKITNLIGEVLEDYSPIPDTGHMFYNDEVRLQNGVKYFVTVKTIDALNRTKIATSDGVTVRIQPPFPGRVRDGKDADLNYQYSTSDLSANWDAFGDNANDPTQSIDHYEVAIGNDRRYESTRSKVYYFVNVGLNKSHTFDHLNLTAKTVRYYITVRAYSLAGSFAEGYSNGIRVGFSEEILPGYVDTKRFQTSIGEISISWRGFKSDIGILQYKVGLSSHKNIITNDTLACEEIDKNKMMFDIKPLEKVGLNEFVIIKHLALEHGRSYYPVVIAEDESGICILVKGQSITVDVTPPQSGDIFINGLRSKSVLFAKASTEMHVEWHAFNDPESGLKSSKVSLFECGACELVTYETCTVIAETVVQIVTEASFYELELVPNKLYKVGLVVTNGAGSSVLANSSIILLDVSSPDAGVVKITYDWSETKSFQFENNTITGKMAIALSKDSFICSNQMVYFPTDNYQNWKPIDGTYSKDFSFLNKSGAYLGIGYNGDFTEITKSGINTPPMNLRSGNYSFKLRVAAGFNIVTSLALISGPNVIPYSLEGKPVTDDFDYSLFDNKNGLRSPENETLTENFNESTTLSPGEFITLNGSYTSNTTLSENDFGIGIHMLGYKIQNNIAYHGLFWVQNKYVSIKRWFQLNFNPTEKEHNYSIGVRKQVSSQQETIDLSLIIDEQELVNIYGQTFANAMKLSMLTWIEDDYKPPIQDIFHPFYTEAFLRQISIPVEIKRECINGKPFFDAESGIKEIWVGVSDTETKADNIESFHLLHRFCYPCKGSCKALCRKDCEYTRLTDDYTIIDLKVTNLHLTEVRLDNKCLNRTREEKCNSSSYYLTTKVVNFAGQTTIVHSNAIQVDVTPPVCEYMKCLDPEYSEDEPTSYIGSSSAIGAYWKCYEDVSLIDHFELYVTSVDGKDTLMNPSNVGTKMKVSFHLGNDTFRDKEDYMVHLRVVNNAGLSNIYNCTVHANLFPPNITATEIISLYAVEAAVDDEPAITDSQSQIGIRWRGGNDEIQFYEWQLGSEPDGEDVFPPIKVGTNHTGAAAIVHGKLELNEEPTNMTVSELHKQDNDAMDTLEANRKRTEREKCFFFMEPGRCVFQTLYAIGWSHWKSKLKSKAVCIKRSQDIQVTKKIQTSRGTISKTRLSSTWQSGLQQHPETTEVVIEANMLDGGLMAGTLSRDDKTSSYGTAATSDFKPYISNPDITGFKNSRILRNRIASYCNVSFYIAPSPVLHYSEVTINITVPDHCKEDTEFQPALIYWNQDKEQWQHVDEGCYPYLTSRGTLEVYTSNICASAESRTVHDNRRSASTLYTQPRAYELVKIRRTFLNNPPNITTTLIRATEDNFLIVPVNTFDSENDNLRFDIMEEPRHAACEINSAGMLNCSLEDDFYGIDMIGVKVTETGLPQFERPYSSDRHIPIHVSPVPDKTDRFFVDNTGQIYRDKRPFFVLTMQTDANLTETFQAGTIVLADVDGDEEFDYKRLSRFYPLGNSTYSVEEIDVTNFSTKSNISSSYRTLKAYNVTFVYSKTLAGRMTLSFIAVNKDGEYTPSVTLDLYVLRNPCAHGVCSHRKTGPAGCSDVARAESFAKFLCICETGYTGQWCEIDINECASKPCGFLFDCHDLVNGYKCIINVPRLIAILLCSFAAIGGVSFIITRLFKIYKVSPRTVGQSNVSMDINMFDIEPQNPNRHGSIFLEPASSRFLPLGYPEFQLSASLQSCESEGSKTPDIWQNQATAEGENTNIELYSLAKVGPGKPNSALHLKTIEKRNPNKCNIDETNQQLEPTLEHEDPALHQYNLCSMVDEKPQSGSVMLEERLSSQMTEIEMKRPEQNRIFIDCLICQNDNVRSIGLLQTNV